MPALTPGGRSLGASRAPIRHHPLIGIHAPTLADLASLPAAASNLDLCLPVQDQANQGSCTSFAHAGLFYACQILSAQDPWIGSFAFNYYMARKREGTTGQDAGAYPQDNLASLVDEGLCALHDMPYNPNVYAVAPSAQQMYDAKHHRLVGAALVAQDLQHLKSVIAGRRVFTFAIDVYTSFENASLGNVPMPDPQNGDRLIGGHDLLAFGYTDDQSWPGGGYFDFQNAWGLGYGLQGRGKIPYAYLADPSLAYMFTTGSGVRT